MGQQPTGGLFFAPLSRGGRHTRPENFGKRGSALPPLIEGVRRCSVTRCGPGHLISAVFQLLSLALQPIAKCLRRIAVVSVVQSDCVAEVRVDLPRFAELQAVLHLTESAARLL